MLSPGDKFIDGTNSVEKLYILIAHYVEHLRPQQQTYQRNNNQDYPPKLFHSALRIHILCHQITTRYLNRN
ncbi:hypothetical protein CKO_01150 [Citrobacter koseri ATCC BAA-895]|uniref:Uncharacterized protein n=1 Tax=Citrobacter koseri (strain ATCC BAA-895 / CDC 4225-83 / SGSC4696) TaxID=290338 RepID=A8AFM7_CITK8|nr:hypothetical protein CKO_01150 [Citrobacter koseri ATCC BAA-895]